MLRHKYLPKDFLHRLSTSNRSFQRQGKGLLLQRLVLLPELPSGQLLPHPGTLAAQLGHQQAQGGKTHTMICKYPPTQRSHCTSIESVQDLVMCINIRIWINIRELLFYFPVSVRVFPDVNLSPFTRNSGQSGPHLFSSNKCVLR